MTKQKHLNNPVYFDGRAMNTEEDVAEWFQELADANEVLIVEFHGGKSTTKLHLDSVHPHFVLAHQEIPTGQYGEVLRVPETIPYTDVLSSLVHIQTRKGKLGKGK